MLSSLESICDRSAYCLQLSLSSVCHSVTLSSIEHIVSSFHPPFLLVQIHVPFFAFALLTFSCCAVRESVDGVPAAGADEQSLRARLHHGRTLCSPALWRCVQIRFDSIRLLNDSITGCRASSSTLFSRTLILNARDSMLCAAVSILVACSVPEQARFPSITRRD